VGTLADPLQLHVSSSLDRNLCAPCTDVLHFDGFIRYDTQCWNPFHTTLDITMDPRLLDELEDDLIEDIIIQELLKTCQSRLGSQKRLRTGSTDLSGHDYVHELLDPKNHERIHEVFRMGYSTFIALRDWLLAHTALRPTKGLTVEEKLAIFLYIVTRPASNRDAQERFSHSGDTISR
jgi:hypothetical protein